MSTNSSIILILLSIGLFFTFINPQYQEVKGLRSVAGQYQDVLQNVSEISRMRDNLLVDYGAVPQEDIDRLNKMFPNHADVVRIALDLDTLAARYGFSINSIQTDPGSSSRQGGIIMPDEPNPYERANITFSFISNYSSFVRFLSDLERSLRVMDIRGVTFSTNAETGLYEHRITVETYWMKQ